jgi:UTP--glucose-1-phosphate uridylyltransferase
MAMGAAIGAFDSALGIRVPRRRFTPVKGTVDLLALRSDAYTVAADGGIRPVEGREGVPPLIKLDARYYKGIEDFEGRLANTPSLKNCRSLQIEGDVYFGKGVVCTGDVSICNNSPRAYHIPDGAELSGVVEI